MKYEDLDGQAINAVTMALEAAMKTAMKPYLGKTDMSPSQIALASIAAFTTMFIAEAIPEQAGMAAADVIARSSHAALTELYQTRAERGGAAAQKPTLN